MKTYYQTTIISLGLLLSTFSLKAQYEWTFGELVLKNGDTLYGQIEIPMGNGGGLGLERPKVKFRKDRGEKVYNFRRKEVVEVIFVPSQYETRYFKYVDLKSRNYDILEEIEYGDISLYCRQVAVVVTKRDVNETWVSYDVNLGYPNTNYTPQRIEYYTEYFVKKKDEDYARQIFSLKTSDNHFNDVAGKYFQDCPEVSDMLYDGYYIKEDIVLIVKEYNECIRKQLENINRD